MTVESRCAPNNIAAGNSYDCSALFDLAGLISGCNAWKIVDSWSVCYYNTPPTENNIPDIDRYKGDPITGNKWITQSDVDNGAGIVIEQVNPRTGYPPLQIVWQAGSSGTMPCASGHAYRHDGEILFNSSIIRIGTQGDWNYADGLPDFDDPTKASDTYEHAWNRFGGSNSQRMYISMDDDWIVPFQADYTLKDFNNLIWIGQYNVKNSAQESISNPAYGILTSNHNANSRLTPDGTLINPPSFLIESSIASHLFGALDENGVFRDWDYMCNPGMEFFLNGTTQPNEFDSTVNIDLMEILVKGRGTFIGHDDRLIGSLRGVYAAMRLGNGAMFDSSKYLCLGDGYGVVVEWDGSTTLV
jgi:hypothetical protein